MSQAIEVVAPAVSQLQWQQMSPINAPEMCCNSCGKKAIPDNKWQMADWYFIKDNKSDHVSYVVCSLECKEKFITHPEIDVYLFDVIDRALQTMGFHFVKDI